jgi:hypothetical protein
MKLRLQNKLALSMLAAFIIGTTTWTAYHTEFASLYGILATFLTCLCLGMGGLILTLLIAYIWLELFEDLWKDTDVDVYGFSYPVKRLELEHRGINVSVLVAGVADEVTSTTTPHDYAMPSHIGYVVNKEDLCFLNEEELAELLNEVYLCEYEVREK